MACPRGLVASAPDKATTAAGTPGSRASFDGASLEFVSDILVVATPEGRVLFANDAFRRRLGYGPGDLARLSLHDLHAPEQRAAAASSLAAALQGRRTARPLPVLTKGGDSLPAEAWA